MLKAETGRGSSGQESRRAERRRLSCAASVVRWGRSIWLLLLLSLVACAIQPSHAAPDQQHPNQDVSISSSKRGVCQSVDVRNKMNDFDKFQGCRVIEGFVQILLIEQANETVFADLVYPDLVEITGYLMFFRVQGLKSIGQLFPNLTVIRGHQLFINYALVAFEMNSLQEVGLHSLTDITRGSVRFEKNPMLCHADTIDWDLIAKQGKAEHVISANKPQNECPVCSKACPSSPTDPKRKLCWNRHRCQKLCAGCGESTCTPEGKCCDESCLGSCSGEGPSACRVCRDMLLNGTRCVSSCPAGTYEFMRRRCVTEHECRRQRKPLESVTTSHFPYKPFASECLLECPPGYQERNSSASHKLVCERCDGPCPKSCLGKNVDSIASAQRLRGCTSITGNLLISIREGQNIVKELEQSLSSIERITGGLKIFRSNPLVSLDFLSSLTEISGENLSKGEHTLSILDNANLQYLWNWTGRPSLKIGTSDGRPRVSIHYNPKLCPQYIEQMRNHTGLPAFDELEVSTTSNGDKVACDITEIRTSVSSMSARAVMITWNQFEHHDMRTLLGYVIYYKEAAHANVSIYDSRDACGFDGWMTVDASANEKSGSQAADIATTSIETSNKDSANPVYRTEDRAKQQQAFLTNLKPYTQYVYYVKTYTISMERSGGQSQLVYFTTKPGQPSVPQHLTAYSNASDTAIISWLPPYEPNSNLTHYKIIGRMEQYDPSFLTHRDYCGEPIPLEPKSISPVIKAAEDKKRAEQELEAAKRPAVDGSGQTGCTCTKREPTEQSEKEVYNSIAFEDALHNSVYIKRGSSDKSNRRKRADGSFMLETVRIKRAMSTYQDKDMMSEGKAVIGSSSSSSNNISASNVTEMLHFETKDEQGAILSFEYDLPVSQLTLVMRGLRHFGRYNVMVKACREKNVNTAEPACSVAATSTVQMLLKEHADDIPTGSFKVSRIPGNDTSRIKLQWHAPYRPNGVIVSYQIEYKNLDLPHHAGVTQCVTNEVLHPTTKEFVVPTNLLAGNYSVKVKALSFAGSGAYTEPAYFYIPESSNQMPVWKMSLIGLMFLLVLMMGGALFGWMYKKKFLRNVPSMRLIATVNPEYVSTVYIPDEWEVARKKIQLLKELGNGSFGMVYEGIAKDVVKGKPELRCAVKTVTENATDRERIEFLKEASVMKGFNTHHVVRLLGVVSQGQPTLVVMELMANGDLKSYLRSHRPDVCENFSRQPPTLKRILQMASEIADGMAYLTAKKFVHRDLAARNCMVADDLTVKIGDFGMTRDVYETDYYRKGTKGLLPVRWMAPESLKDGVFTSFSDVWSYGVVLWEMVTLASQPYQGLSNDQVLKYVIDGGVMERPENCPDSLYIMMRDTWNHKATRRPTFIDIVESLLKEIDVAAFERVSFFHSPDGIEARNQNATQFHRIDKDLELVTLQDLREDEAEGEEDSPLRQDFGDFSSFEPIANVKNGGSGAAAFGMEPFHSTRDSSSKPVGLGFLELNSSKAPLKAGFDDFDGVSSNSLASSKDTLNLPFVEDGQAKSVSNSPFARNKSSSKGNLSQSSAGRSSLSPQSPNIIAAACPADNSGSRGSPSIVTSMRSDPEYENRSPESVVSVGRDVVSLRVGFPSMDAIDDDDSASEQQQQQQPIDSRSASSTPHQQPSSPQLVVAAKQQQQQPAEVQQLNNGFIGGAAT